MVSESYNSKGEFVNKNKFIGNSCPIVTNRVDVSRNGIIIPHVAFKLAIKDKEDSDLKILPIKDLGKVDWANDVDTRCILNPDVSKTNEHMANIIRLQYADTEATEVMTIVDQLGGHLIEGVPAFNTGDDLIWPYGLENKPKVIFEPVPNKRFVVDPNCTEKDADAAMTRIVDLSPDAGRIILSLNIMCVMWEAFKAAGITPRCIVFIYGVTGAKKTTYAAFATQLYNRDQPLERPDRFNASPSAAVKLLQKVRDGVIVLDDLYPADSSEIRRQQEKTLLEIIRIIADGTEPARVKGGQVTKNPPRCGLLGTGEYYIGTGSDAARLFPVEIKAPIDSSKLTACQLEPLMLSTFYRYYIEWYITNFYEIVSLLKEWKAAYLETKTNVHDRLQETQFCLEAAYKLYLTYRTTKGFMTEDESLNHYSSFYHQLRAIVKEQDARSKQGKNGLHSKPDYLVIIRTIYQNRGFRLVDDVKQFNRYKHDGVIYGNHLYLRKEWIITRIRAYDPAVDFDEVLDNLMAQRALKLGRSGTSRQLHRDSNNDGKKMRKDGVGGLRFYAIKLSKLEYGM